MPDHFPKTLQPGDLAWVLTPDQYSFSARAKRCLGMVIGVDKCELCRQKKEGVPVYQYPLWFELEDGTIVVSDNYINHYTNKD